MSDVKISALPAVTSVATTDVIPVVTGGVTSKIGSANFVNSGLSGGTANGVLYLNGSKAATSGSALTFDGTNLGVGTSSPTNALSVTGSANITGNTTLGDASTDTVTVNGYMGVGGAPISSVGVYITSNALTNTNQHGVLSTPTGTSAATAYISAFTAAPKTAATAFTTTDIFGYRSVDATKGAGSTITNQHGLYITDQTQGTNNYGITSVVSSGTNKWNIYASGTANNYFAGNVGIGTSSPGAKLEVIGGNIKTDPFTRWIGYWEADTVHDGYLVPYNATGFTEIVNSASSGGLLFKTGTSKLERARISSDGTFRVKGAGTAGSTDAVQFSGSAPDSSLLLDASGRLLLGATSASSVGNATLGVVGSSVYDGQFSLIAQFTNDTTSAGKGVLLGFNNSTNTGIISPAYGNGTESLAFWTYKGATWGERMRLSSDGTFRVKGAGTAGSTDAVQFSGSAPDSSMSLDSYGNLHIPGGGGISTNEAFGTGALRSNTTGIQNTAIGNNALFYNTTGSYNTASGLGTLQNNTTGDQNTASGRNALFYNTTGSNNTAIGLQALQSNITGNSNTASGIYALLNSGKTVTAGSFVVGVSYTIQSIGTTDFTLIGAASNTVGLVFTTTGVGTGTGTASSNTNYNSAFGYQSLYNNTTGIGNTAIGRSALQSNTTGSGNTALSPSNSAGTYAPVFDPTTENNRFCMGSTAVTNAYIQVAWTVVSDLRDKLLLGDVPHGLDFVTKLKPIKYQFKESRDSDIGHGPIKYGFGAQDVLALEGNDAVIVDTEVEDKLKITDSHLVPVLVKAIQELKAELDELKSQLGK